jgi:hypothetical protein
LSGTKRRTGTWSCTGGWAALGMGSEAELGTWRGVGGRTMFPGWDRRPGWHPVMRQEAGLVPRLGQEEGLVCPWVGSVSMAGTCNGTGG